MAVSRHPTHLPDPRSALTALLWMFIAIALVVLTAFGFWYVTVPYIF